VLVQQAGSLCIEKVLKFSPTYLGLFTRVCNAHNFWTLPRAYSLAACILNATCKKDLIEDAQATPQTTTDQALQDGSNVVSGGDCFKNGVSAITCAKNLTSAGVDQLITVIKIYKGFLCIGSIISTYLTFGTTFGFFAISCSSFAKDAADVLYDLSVCLDNKLCKERLVRIVDPLVGVGGNLWVTGHDAEYHCSQSVPSSGAQCHYLQVAVDFVTKKSTLPILALDRGTQVHDALSMVYGATSHIVTTMQTVKPVDFNPTTQPLMDSDGLPNYSAIIVASDITCGGTPPCDNNTLTATPDSDAINAHATEIAQFFSSTGGILALAGANHSNVYYNFLPVPVTATAVTPPFTLTSSGQSLGLTDSDINCCQTHNSFQLPNLGSQLDVVETDSAGLAETMRVLGGFAGAG
jgi:hypothetical protein